jgi:PRTRC genetic system ThiF family protein
MEKSYVHYTHPYLLTPPHPVTVQLVGVGGTGSAVLAELTRIHFALLAHDHPGLIVVAYDPDTYSEANVGRQECSPSEIGTNKAIAAISRINRFYGLCWEAKPVYYDANTLRGKNTNYNGWMYANIILTCVDTARARMDIGKLLKSTITSNFQWSQTEYMRPYYWLDFGNGRSTGQVVLGTLLSQRRQEDHLETESHVLPTILDLYPNLDAFDTEEQQGPSCSLAEALKKQGLFINRMVAMVGCDLLWQLFDKYKIAAHGAFVNMGGMTMNPIPIPPCQTLAQTA